ncbi:hypothetical protein AAMO2058_001327700 [Amorphochlora amoebiformis]
MPKIHPYSPNVHTYDESYFQGSLGSRVDTDLQCGGCLRWRNLDTIKDKAKRGSPFRYECYSTSRVKARYPEVEKRLLDKFLLARSNCHKITRRWFESTSKELLEEYPDDEQLKKKVHQLSDA